MRKFAMILAAVCATTLFAADVTGKWSAEMEGRDGNKRAVTLNLKADGDKLTGTVAGPRGDNEILDGKISGDDISFNVKMEMNGESRVIPYSGKITGEELKMKMGTGNAHANLRRNATS
ncbi:MAG: hypothetical protein WKF37_06570 [Bryobacteraceae bacterium]